MSKQNVIVESRRRISYEKRIFALLDILGFRSIVEAAKDDASRVAEIGEMLRLASSQAILPKDYTFKFLQVNMSKYVSHIFSDTVTISCPFESYDDYNFTCGWVEIFQHLMWEKHGTFLRGAIVYGDICDDEHMIFGPALIRAYDIERKKADWPRVLVDQSVLEILPKTKVDKGYSENLQKDKRGFTFVDYLRGLFHIYPVREQARHLAKNKELSNEIKGSSHPIQFMQVHKTRIEQAFNNFNNLNCRDKKILRKYTFLAKYHNSVVDLMYNKLIELSTSQSLINSIVSDTMLAGLLTHSGYAYTPRFTADDPKYTDTMPLLGMALNLLYDDWDDPSLDTLNENELVGLLSQKLPHYIHKLMSVFPSLSIRIRRFG